MRRNQGLDLSAPGMVRAHQVEQVSQHGQGVVKQLGFVGVKRGRDVFRLLVGRREAQCEASVPHPAVMGAVVANHGEMVGKRDQDAFIQSILVGYLLAVSGSLQVLEPA